MYNNPPNSYGGYDPNYFLNNPAPSGTGSMVEPSNPRFKNSWQQQNTPKKHSWIIPAIIGLIIIIVVPIVLLLLAPKDNPGQQGGGGSSEEDKTAGIDDDHPNPTSDEAEVNAYFTYLASNPDYVASFNSTETLYSEPPEKLTCNNLTEVTNMNSAILKLYLDAGYVVAISGKGNAPFSSEGNTLLIFGGSLAETTYNTIPYDCPSASKTANHTTYSGSEIFSNLKSDKRYYVWIDLYRIYTGDEE